MFESNLLCTERLPRWAGLNYRQRVYSDCFDQRSLPSRILVEESMKNRVARNLKKESRRINKRRALLFEKHPGLDKGRVEKLLGTTANTRNTVLSIERGSWYRFSDEAQKYQCPPTEDCFLYCWNITAHRHYLQRRIPSIRFRNKEHNGPLSHQVLSPVPIFLAVPIGQVIIGIEFIFLWRGQIFFSSLTYSLVKFLLNC